MDSEKKHFRYGSASIYVVVMATLLFGVITVSFIRIIMNEMSKTTSDELSQSAYDSALAGVEDAKIALKKYYNCISAGAGAPSECTKIEDGIEQSKVAPGAVNDTDEANNNEKCDGIAEALGRTHNNGEVSIGDDATNQAYTCVLINDSPSDYRANFSAASSTSVVPLRAANPNEVTAVKISWVKIYDGIVTNFYDSSFKEDPYVPPALSAQIIQSAESFTIKSFEETSGSATNRGTVILAPSDSGNNFVGASVLLNSNNHTSSANKREPQSVKCDSTADYICHTIIKIPQYYTDGVNNTGGRNQDTFFLILTDLYGQATEEMSFSVEMCINNTGLESGVCDTTPFLDTQIAVDATGRASDMYSRVEARIEFIDLGYPYPGYAIQTSGTGEDSIKKNFYVTNNCLSVADDGTVSRCANGDTGESS